MTLRAVPGKGKGTDVPLWEKPFIPIKKSEEGRDVPIATRITKAQRRSLDVLIASQKRPEIQTISDFVYMAFYLMQDYVLRTTPNLGPELEQMARTQQREARDGFRKERIARATAWLEDREDELKGCMDLGQKNVVKPDQFLQCFTSLEEGKDDLPPDLKPQASKIWLLFRPHAQALRAKP